MKFYIIVIIFASILSICLNIVIGDLIISGLITFMFTFFVIFCFMIFISIRNILILDEKCDPIRFLEANEKLYKIIIKNRNSRLLYGINQSAGLISLGEFDKGKDILLSCKYDYSKCKNKIITFVYDNNLVYCLYELGEISEAEDLYDLIQYKYHINNKKMNLSLELLKAERLFFLKNYVESKEKFFKLQTNKFSKRTKLNMLYFLAQIDEKMGNTDQAIAKYSEIVEKGNKLWIVTQANNKLDMYKDVEDISHD